MVQNNPEQPSASGREDVPRKGTLTVTFLSHNRPPKCAPNPSFPEGMRTDIAGDAIGCAVDIPYPAECCGVWLIECPICGMRVGLTAAGRVDDVRWVRIPCKLEGRA